MFVIRILDCPLTFLENRNLPCGELISLFKL
jgi:hypothetical protein